MLMHVSYAFPSHLVLVFEVLLVALAALVAVLGRARWEPMARRTWRLVRRALRGRSRASGLWAIGLAAALATAGVCLVEGVPIPRVSDEWSYLLAADTFASGRLANPPLELAEHFRAEHVLARPTYASKYPPASGLLLAPGQALGLPALGLWLQAGLLAAAAVWMLLPLLPPPWPLLGGLVVILRFGIGGYWHQSYWGGGAAAIAGCLVIGALVRLLDEPRVSSALLLALGVGLLANSRYYEGLIFALPCAVVIGVHTWRLEGARRRRFLLRVWAPVAALLALVAGGMALYDLAVTGDALRLPHLEYTATGELGQEFGHFLWTHPETRAAWPAGAVARFFLRTSYVLQFQLGLALTLPLIFLAAPGALRDRRLRVVLAVLLVFLAGQALTRSWWQHYAAPATGALLVLALCALRRLTAWRYRGQRLGRTLAIAAVVTTAVMMVIQVPAYRADEGDWSRRRQAIDARVRSLPGRHLVVVRYDDAPVSSWTYNGADLESAKVLWANEVEPAAGRELVASFPDRTAWLLTVTARSRDERLEPYPAAPVDPVAGAGGAVQSSMVWPSGSVR